MTHVATEAREKISAYPESLEFQKFFDTCFTKFENYQILLNKIGHRFPVKIQWVKEPHWFRSAALGNDFFFTQQAILVRRSIVLSLPFPSLRVPGRNLIYCLICSLLKAESCTDAVRLYMLECWPLLRIFTQFNVCY